MATVSNMTTEQLLSLPDDGIERDLVRGELRERPMTKRNRRRSRVEARLALLLGKWLEGQRTRCSPASTSSVRRATPRRVGRGSSARPLSSRASTS
jgi:hypothetical protein